MRRPGSSRRQIARMLNAAYADGLISHDTFVRRLDGALATGLVDPRRLVGDLSFPAAGRTWVNALASRLRTIIERPRQFGTLDDAETVLLALDWSGAGTELVIGRHHACDVVLPSPDVSRRHARFFYRDGHWIVQDLESTNGTLVNGERVGRRRLHAGDELILGTQRLEVD